jgi:hypothetical protein
MTWNFKILIIIKNARTKGEAEIKVLMKINLKRFKLELKLTEEIPTLQT